MIDERTECVEKAQGEPETVARSSGAIYRSEKEEGKLIVRAQALPKGFTTEQLTYDIISDCGEKLCGVRPGGEVIVPIEKETVIYAMPAFGFKSEKSKTDRIKIMPDKTTRLKLTFVKVLSGYGVKTVLEEEVDRLDN
ncbi:MAG: hypothetical protein ACI4SC_00080 [Candidatus Neoclostridium sp.]